MAIQQTPKSPTLPRSPGSEAEIAAEREREIADMEGGDDEAQDDLSVDDSDLDETDDQEFEAPPETPQAAVEPRLNPQELAERVRQADIGRAEARREAQQAKAQAEAMEQAFQEVMRRVQIQQYQQAQPQQITDPNDPNFDPVGFFQSKTQTLEQQVQALNQHLAMQQQQQQQAAELNHVLSVADQSEQEFAARQPDYPDALRHLRRGHIQELKFAFPDATQQQILDTLNNDEIQLARRAQQLGRKPAEFVYEIARYRGYQPQTQPQRRSNGQNGYQQPSQQMERLQQGMQASRTLSSARGGQDQEMTLERLSSLKGAAFDAAWKRLKSQGAFKR